MKPNYCLIDPTTCRLAVACCRGWELQRVAGNFVSVGSTLHMLFQAPFPPQMKPVKLLLLVHLSKADSNLTERLTGQRGSSYHSPQLCPSSRFLAATFLAFSSLSNGDKQGVPGRISQSLDPPWGYSSVLESLLSTCQALGLS